MQRSKIVFLALASALTVPLFLGGCDREISRTSDTQVKGNGTVKEKETTVTQSPNGTVTKEQTESKTTPQNP